MATSRRSRLLVLAAALLLLIFIVSTSHNNELTSQILKANNSFNKNVDPGSSESTAKPGGTKESLIKQKEEEQLQTDHDLLKSSGVKADKQADTNPDKATPPVAVAPAKTKDTVTLVPGKTAKPSSVAFDAAKELQTILSMAPVVMFSKTYCGYSKALKNLLSLEYEITPSPTIVELDIHKNGRELQDYIAEVSGRKTVPNLFVNGVSRGGSDDMKALHSADELLGSLKTWGGKGVSVNKINAPSNS